MLSLIGAVVVAFTIIVGLNTITRFIRKTLKGNSNG